MPHLIGDRIALREYRISDLDSISQWVNDPEITNTLSDVFLYPHSRNESETYLNVIMEGKSSTKRFCHRRKRLFRIHRSNRSI